MKLVSGIIGMGGLVCMMTLASDCFADAGQCNLMRDQQTCDTTYQLDTTCPKGNLFKCKTKKSDCVWNKTGDKTCSK
jgi:hypothetical protein